MATAHAVSEFPPPDIPLKNMTSDSITDNVIAINSRNPDPRFKYVLERAVVHLHEFARETRLSFDEWMAATEFLVKVGQISTDVRHEFILLSDVLGLSLLVDAIDNPKPAASTEGTLLGPFHTHEAEMIKDGGLMSHDENGTPLIVACTIRDTAGKPIGGCKVDIWEADSNGFYDVQRPGRKGPDGRCLIMSDDDGAFWFNATVPVPYPIPHDGPVGQLLKNLRRHPMRPAHVHFIFEKEGFDRLVTALYLRNDPYEQSDAVFGVKDSLVVDLSKTTEEMSKKYNVPAGTALLTYDFVLVTEKEAQKERNNKSIEALEKLGRRVKILNGLPVPDVD